MKKFTLILSIFIFVAITVNAQWEQTNCPHTSRVTCIATSGTNVFAGFQDDGIYVSTDNGANWTEANTGLTNSCLRDIAISGTNIYAATPGSGVFLSTNNGANWTSINTGITNDYATAVVALLLTLQPEQMEVVYLRQVIMAAHGYQTITDLQI